MSAKSNWKVFKGQMRQLTRNPKIQAEIMQDFAARERLFNQIHSEIELELNQLKKAQDYADGGYRTQLENSPELYGFKRSLLEIYTLHCTKGTCDQETSEIERALIYCASRHDSPDKPI